MWAGAAVWNLKNVRSEWFSWRQWGTWVGKEGLKRKSQGPANGINRQALLFW
jgi:hypothetical protein